MATFYILYSPSIERFYIGSCADFDLRLKQHLEKSFDKSFTRKANDWETFYKIDKLDMQLARKIESHVKKMKSKQYIKNLVKYPEIISKLIEKYSAGSSR